MRKSDIYQIALISLGVIAVAFFGVFLYREIFPEYKIYQEDYIALEKFRSTYTGEPPPDFKVGVKQIVIEKPDNTSPTIDRCSSCHVALEVPYFSPTKIAYDINGALLLDAQGNPVKVPNEDYIWARLDQKVAELRDVEVNKQLTETGEGSKVKMRLKEADRLSALKTAQVGDRVYDVTKVLSMHPLIGKETRPFEYHPVSEYGCVSCHNGNGRGLTSEKAHGPVFDGQYEEEYEGPEPIFLESDPQNDPQFSRIFNHKPGSELIFQTTPVFVGGLLEAKCVQCHLTSAVALQGSLNISKEVTNRSKEKAQAIETSFLDEKQAVISVVLLILEIQEHGIKQVINDLKKRSENYSLPATETKQASAQLQFIQQHAGKSPEASQKQMLEVLHAQLRTMIGSSELAEDLLKSSSENDKTALGAVIDTFIEEHRTDPQAQGVLFVKNASWNLGREMTQHVRDTEISLQQAVTDENFMNAVTADIDTLTKHYHDGERLFISQACYACHRIAGFSRGGVGPELTSEGNSYPWFIKQSIVWPQADTPNSAMPNERLDHEELENLMTYLLAQHGDRRAMSDTNYKTYIQEWESRKILSKWENPITPSQMHDVRYAMMVFASEGCAACHRLKGFESNVGYAVEKDGDWDARYKEHLWFTRLFPEEIFGSELVTAIDHNKKEIDQRIVDQVRQETILEEIDKKHPGLVDALYSNFKYAMRAKNHHYDQLISAEKDSQKKKELENELKQWQERVRRVLMVYIQEYGFGRLICPKPNWAGVYRSDEWLMEHFRNPGIHSPQSIMPAFPFDDTKFYALTHMLDVLGIRNRDEVREIWKHRGFSPALAFQTLCSQCHGENRVGNGPVSQWIYPIPKNLRNAEFLRNMTKERIIQSIAHGVKGTPMPPWGEVDTDKPTNDGVPVLTASEISLLVDWLFSSVPGGEVIKSSQEVPKWQYGPDDIIEELRKEGEILENHSTSSNHDILPPELAALPTGHEYFAALNPIPTPTNKSLVSQDIFDVRSPPVPGLDEKGYYIKDKYYTDRNILEGRQFFEVNCAECHGKEADGTGIRGEVMQDAKPRMLINLDWLNMHDDIYLLRSIKFGVPGTAMTPWGDFTSSLQRLQLVIYIRSLSREREQRDTLTTEVFQTFESARLQVERARIADYPQLVKLKEQYAQQKVQEESTRKLLLMKKASPEEATASYLKAVELQTQLQHQQSIDQLYLDLLHLVKREADLYVDIGNQLISRNLGSEPLEIFLKLVSFNKGRYTFAEGTLSVNNSENTRDELEQRLIAILDKRIAENNKAKIELEGKIPSPQILDELSHVNAEMASLMKLKKAFIINFAEAERLRQQQLNIIKNLKSQRQ